MLRIRSGTRCQSQHLKRRRRSKKKKKKHGKIAVPLPGKFGKRKTESAKK